MIKDTITMSEKAFGALMELYGCSGTHQLPKNPDKGNEAMKKFLAGREELCEKGWAELDFDGSLHPTAWFARMTYTLPRCTASMCFQVDDIREWYLRGPIELLHIEQSAEGYILSRCGTDELVAWVKRTLYQAEVGCLITEQGVEKLETEFVMNEKGQKSRSDELVKHMCMYFEKEAYHA